MKKIILEIPIPAYKWVDVPTNYGTILGEFSCLHEVNLITNLVEFLQRHEDRHSIIEMEHRMRCLLCRELVREKLPFIKEEHIYHYGEKLSGFLADFQERVGNDFDSFKVGHRVLSNGKKIQFETFSMLFNNEDEAYRHIAKIYTSGKNFDFTLVEK